MSKEDHGQKDMAPKPWIKVDKNVVDLLPKNKEYTQMEAYISLRLDLDKNEGKGVREYARIWRWSKSSVDRFFKKIGHKTGMTKQQYEAGQKRDRSGTATGTHISLIFNELKHSNGTATGTEAGQKRDTTIKNKNKDKDINTLADSDEFAPEVNRIYDSYRDHVRAGHSVRAKTNIASRIRQGYSVNDLIESGKAYGVECEEDGTARKWMTLPQNFYGKKAQFKDYLPKVRNKKQQQKPSKLRYAN